MSRSQFTTTIGALMGLALVLGLAACESDDDGGLGAIVPAGGPQIPANEYVSSVSQDQTEAPYTAEPMPVGTAAAPLLLGARQYVEGASVILQVGAPAEATELLVSVSGAFEGYWTVDLGAATKATVLPIEQYLPGAESFVKKASMSEGPEVTAMLAENTYLITVTPTGEDGRSTFTIVVAARTPEGVTDDARHYVSRNATAHGSDWLQVSLNWMHPVDMDLHLETPEGEDIYWAHKTGTNGGFLDLDSNAACTIDGVQNENIRWLRNPPTAGNYVLRVDLWSACEQNQTFPFLVSVILDGEMTLYQGEMSPNDADAGGEFAGRVITNISVPALN